MTATRLATLTCSDTEAVERRAMAADLRHASSHHEARGRKILVADGDRTVLELLQIRLDVAGYHACVARSGPEVLEILKNLRPAGIVLDLGLPEMDGFAVLETLLARRDALPFPTLVMGRKLAPEHLKRAAGLGACGCLVKPFSGADALQRVARMLRSPPPAPRAMVLNV
jgi:DNA-binding response OmpR family regulator